MIAYEAMLKGGVAMFGITGKVTRTEWYNFVEALDLTTNFPGIQGIGFAQSISPTGVSAHEAEVREQGFPEYRIWPPGPRDFVTSIVYLEPFEGTNLRAFGYDMFTESVRRAAMQEACDTGEPTMSHAVTLVQERDRDPQRGFLIYLPVYKSGSRLDTKEDRRAALSGFVYSPFRVRDMLQGTLGTSLIDVGIELFDGNNLAPENLLYSGDLSIEAQNSSRRGLAEHREIRIANHSWTLFTYADQRPFWRSPQSLIIVVSGLAISLLLSASFTGAFRREERAQAIAAEMTRALQVRTVELEAENRVRVSAEEEARSAQRRIGEILRATGIGTWEWDLIHDSFVVDEQWNQGDHCTVPPNTPVPRQSLLSLSSGGYQPFRAVPLRSVIQPG